MTVLYKVQTSAIETGGNLGATAFDLGDAVLPGIIIDANWDTGDHLGFKVSATEGGTYVPLYDDAGSLVTIAVAASQAYALDPQKIGQWRFIKPWSHDGSGNNAAQADGSVVTLVCK